MRRRRRRGMGPVGTIALIWIIFAGITSLVRLSGVLIAAGLAIMASVWAANALRRKAEKDKARTKPSPCSIRKSRRSRKSPPRRKLPPRNRVPTHPKYKPL